MRGQPCPPPGTASPCPASLCDTAVTPTQHRHPAGDNGHRGGQKQGQERAQNGVVTAGSGRFYGRSAHTELALSVEMKKREFSETLRCLGHSLCLRIIYIIIQ